MSQFSAVIFDFDGIIADTEPLHYKAMQEALEPEGMGYPWKDYVGMYIGFDDRDAIRERYKNAGKKLGDDKLKDLVARKAAAFLRIAKTAGAKTYPGVVELITSLSGRKPVAVCSGALRQDIDPILHNLGIPAAFDVIVTADEVEKSKPDPACYSLTVQRLQRKFPDAGITPKSCLAIEDTPTGVQAAKAAGLRVVAVTNSHGRDKLFGADRIVHSVAVLKV